MQPGRHSRPLPLPRSQSAPRLLPCPPQVEMVERPHTPLAIASRRTPSTHSLDQFDELLEEGEADIAVYVEPPELESGFQPTITVICRNIRDKALREIDSYQFLSRQDEHEYWEDVRDHTRFYPLTVFSVQACLASTRALLDSPHSHHEVDLKWRKFRQQVKVWRSWDDIEVLLNLGELQASVLDAAEFTLGHPIMSIASDHWESCAEMMKHALEHDLCDFSRVVSNIVGSKRDIIMDLPTEQVRIIMEILQELIDSHFAEHRIFERVLRKVVKTRRILPSYLFLSGVKRSGAYAVTGGGFADVWRGELEGKPVALKVVRVFELNNKATEMHQNFCEEAMMWRQFRHPNILPFLGIYEHEDSLALVSPWMPEGHVGTFLRTHPDANRLEIVRGIANGICYLHGLKPQVVHGDLHPRNILIDSHEQPRIADFGLSKINDSQGTSNMAATSHGGGILRWQAPELLNPERFGHEHARATTCSDVYAFSFICYEIFTDQVPLSNLADVAVLVAVAVHDRRPVRPEGISAITRGLGENMWNLLQSCWKPKADERPTMLEVTRKLSPPHIRSSSNTTNDATLRAEGSPGPQVNSYDDETTYRSKFAFTHLESARRFLSTLPDLDEVTTELNRVGLQYLHFGGPKGTFKVFFERRNKPASFMKVVRIAKVWKDLRHENIAQLYGYCVISRNPGLVHASGTHGNLENYLRSRMHMVTVRTPKKLELLMDVAEGLRYLHSQNLLHGKLRAANVHVGNDDRALLCDFSFPITDAGAHNPQIGNDEVEADYVRWLAYELFDEHVSTMRKLTFATDMYSYGCLMHEVLSGELPYYDISIRDVESEKRQKRSPARPDGVSDKPWALMKEFWSADPTSRPNASDVCTMLQELTKQMHMLRV